MEKKWDVNTIINVIKDTLEPKNENKKTYLKRFEERKKGDHDIIEQFQDELAKNLSERCNNTCLGSEKEYELYKGIKDWDKIKDRADIRIEKINLNGKDYELIIEIDATRADQVAKKMMSRFCYAILRKDKLPIVYVALLYKGTSSMNLDECKKFFKMGYELIKKIEKSNIMIGYIIGDPKSPYIFQEGNESKKCDDIKDGEAFDSDLYRRYLEDHDVHSPDSIECYMLPHNKIYSSQNTDTDKNALINDDFDTFLQDYNKYSIIFQGKNSIENKNALNNKDGVDTFVKKCREYSIVFKGKDKDSDKVMDPDEVKNALNTDDFDNFIRNCQKYSIALQGKIAYWRKYHDYLKYKVNLGFDL